MKWCLHKGLAWCTLCKKFHCDPWVELTSFGDQFRMLFCQACGGYKTAPHYEDELEWGFGYG